MLEVVAAIEVAVLIEAIVDRGVDGGKHCQPAHHDNALDAVEALPKEISGLIPVTIMPIRDTVVDRARL